MAVEDYIPNKFKRKIHIDLEEHNVDADLKRRADEIFRFGRPQMGPEIYYYKNHVLSYNQERKIPRWTMEHIKASHVIGPASRRELRYSPDPRIPPLFSAISSDFKDSGWARGRLVSAGDHKHDQQAMAATYMMSNVVPQEIDNNAGYWNRLEIYCRSLVDRYEDIYIMSGPIFIPNEEGNSDKRVVRHYVTGRNDVNVPTHLFKIIVADRGDGSNPVLGAFVIPNRPITDDPPLKKYDVSLDYIEQHTGLTVFPGLNRHTVRDLCHVDDCQLVSVEHLALELAERRIDAATSVKQLNDTWLQLRRFNVRPTEELKEQYRAKRKVLDERQQLIQQGGE